MDFYTQLTLLVQANTKCTKLIQHYTRQKHGKVPVRSSELMHQWICSMVHICSSFNPIFIHLNNIKLEYQEKNWRIKQFYKTKFPQHLGGKKLSPLENPHDRLKQSHMTYLMSIQVFIQQRFSIVIYVFLLNKKNKKLIIYLFYAS